MSDSDPRRPSDTSYRPRLRQAIGTRRDQYGNPERVQPKVGLQTGGLSTGAGHDWSAFDAHFHPKQQAAPAPAVRPVAAPAPVARPMAAAAPAAAVPVAAAAAPRVAAAAAPTMRMASASAGAAPTGQPLNRGVAKGIIGGSARPPAVPVTAPAVVPAAAPQPATPPPDAYAADARAGLQLIQASQQVARPAAPMAASPAQPMGADALVERPPAGIPMGRDAQGSNSPQYMDWAQDRTNRAMAGIDAGRADAFNAQLGGAPMAAPRQMPQTGQVPATNGRVIATPAPEYAPLPVKNGTVAIDPKYQDSWGGIDGKTTEGSVSYGPAKTTTSRRIFDETGDVTAQVMGMSPRPAPRQPAAPKQPAPDAYAVDTNKRRRSPGTIQG